MFVLAVAAAQEPALVDTVWSFAGFRLISEEHKRKLGDLTLTIIAAILIRI